MDYKITLICIIVLSMNFGAVVTAIIMYVNRGMHDMARIGYVFLALVTMGIATGVHLLARMPCG